jgi:hypothetical protein
MLLEYLDADVDEEMRCRRCLVNISAANTFVIDSIDKSNKAAVAAINTTLFFFESSLKSEALMPSSF